MWNTKYLVRGIAGVVLLCVLAGVWLLPGFRLGESPQGEQGPHFGVASENETWYLEDPQGRKFFSTGINTLIPRVSGSGPKYDGLADYHGDLEQWKVKTLERLNRWNVNTIGAWSTLRGKAYVLELSLTYKWIDVFEEDFATYVHTAALDALNRNDVASDYATLDKDPLLIGYFTDNELEWGGESSWTRVETEGEKGSFSLFEYYAGMEPKSGGKKRWASYMAETYDQDWDKLSDVWELDVDSIQDLTRTTRIAPRSPGHLLEAARVGDVFLRLIAERYFEVTSREMRGHLPHHLNLGVRLTPGFPDVVAKVEGAYVDVASINVYTRDLDFFRDEITRLYNAGARPVLITEFAFPARENRSGNKNIGFEDAEVQDDAERGAYYARCVEMFGEMPFVVGLHWFQHHDEPTNGRPEDGESVNFGFVDVYNRVYEDLARSATEANARVLQRRGGAIPDSISEVQ